METLTGIFLDFYLLTMVKPRIYQFSGFYGNTCKEGACEAGICKYEIARNWHPKLALHKSRATKYCTVADNICGLLVWNVLCITFVPPRISRRSHPLPRPLERQTLAGGFALTERHFCDRQISANPCPCTVTEGVWNQNKFQSLFFNFKKSLNLLEPSGPAQACNGTAFFYHIAKPWVLSEGYAYKFQVSWMNFGSESL
jgi:hypothetical protein